MNVVKAEKCRSIITDALNNARKSVLNSQEERYKTGKILISSVSAEKGWFDDYARNALVCSPYEADKAFAILGFTNMIFGLGNYDNGLVFLEDGIFFKGSGGGYSMDDFIIRYEDFANSATVLLVQKSEDQRFGKRTVVDIKFNGKDNLIDLTNTGCAPKAFLRFLSDLKGDLAALFEFNHESGGSNEVKKEGTAGDPDEETVSAESIARTYSRGSSVRVKCSDNGECKPTGIRSGKTETTCKLANKNIRAVPNTSSKKRIAFLLLGAIFGFIGLHFLYAKRYVLFALTLANFILLIVSAVANQSGLVVLSVILLLVFWPCFTLFGSRDGNKLKMKWF